MKKIKFMALFMALILMLTSCNKNNEIEIIKENSSAISDKVDEIPISQPPPEIDKDPIIPEEPVSTPEEVDVPVENDYIITGIEVTGVFHYEEAKKAFELLNNFRAENNLPPMEWSTSLENAGKTRAVEASVVWSHTRPDGSLWHTVGTKGENLCKGYDTAEGAFNAWLDSKGHKENMLREFTQVYVAFFDTENGWFWSMVFDY